jgi:hypothetical protein
MAAPMLVAAAMAGNTLQAYGQYKASLIQAKQLNLKAGLLDIEAQEILDRNAINNFIIGREGLRLQGAQLSALASSGRTTGQSFAPLEETARRVIEEQILNERVAVFEASQRRFEAAQSRFLAKETRKAGVISAFSTLLTGSANTALAAGTGGGGGKKSVGSFIGGGGGGGGLGSGNSIANTRSAAI